MVHKLDDVLLNVAATPWLGNIGKVTTQGRIVHCVISSGCCQWLFGFFLYASVLTFASVHCATTRLQFSWLVCDSLLISKALVPAFQSTLPGSSQFHRKWWHEVLPGQTRKPSCDPCRCSLCRRNGTYCVLWFVWLRWWRAAGVSKHVHGPLRSQCGRALWCVVAAWGASPSKNPGEASHGPGTDAMHARWDKAARVGIWGGEERTDRHDRWKGGGFGLGAKSVGDSDPTGTGYDKGGECALERACEEAQHDPEQPAETGLHAHDREGRVETPRTPKVPPR